MNTELAFMVIGHDTLNPLAETVRCLTPHPCYWKESRLLRMGQEMGLMGRVSGNWDVVAKIELALQNLEKKSGLRCFYTRTDGRLPDNTLYPYSVQIVAADMPGHALMLIQFFLDQGVTIEDMCTEPYITHTHTAMISLAFNIGVPYSIQISDLRERFLVLCDTHNMDGMMEPVKG